MFQARTCKVEKKNAYPKRDSPQARSKYKYLLRQDKAQSGEQLLPKYNILCVHVSVARLPARRRRIHTFA